MVDDLFEYPRELIRAGRCEMAGIVEVLGEETFCIEEVVELHIGIQLLELRDELRMLSRASSLTASRKI